MPFDEYIIKCDLLKICWIIQSLITADTQPPTTLLSKVSQEITLLDKKIAILFVQIIFFDLFVIQNLFVIYK